MYSTYTIKYGKDDLEPLDYHSLTEASKILNGVAFKLYIFLSERIKENQFELSLTQFSNDFGISAMSSRYGIIELIEKGFLIGENGTYTFSRIGDSSVKDFKIVKARDKFK